MATNLPSVSVKSRGVYVNEQVRREKAARKIQNFMIHYLRPLGWDAVLNEWDGWGCNRRGCSPAIIIFGRSFLAGNLPYFVSLDNYKDVVVASKARPIKNLCHLYNNRNQTLTKLLVRQLSKEHDLCHSEMFRRNMNGTINVGLKELIFLDHCQYESNKCRHCNGLKSDSSKRYKF